MANFSKTSLDRMQGVFPELQDLAFKIVTEHMDCFILEYGGVRTEAEQQKLVAEGKSKTMKSKHLEGRAIDLAPYPWEPNNIKRFYYFTGIVMGVAKEMGIDLRWGGDWDMDYDLDDQTFNDLCHFELVN